MPSSTEEPILVIRTADFTDPKIIVSCGNHDELLQLSKILNLELDTARFRKLNNSLYEVRPSVIKKRYPTLNLRNKRDKEYRYLKDFASSDEFYAFFGKKTGAKIVYDDYSTIRARVLFDYFHLWESNIRLSLIENAEDINQFNEYIKSKHPKNSYRRSSPDHRIACFELSDFIDFTIESKRALNSKKETQINKSTADSIRLIRNASFHFRVVTPHEYKSVFQSIYINQLLQNLDAMMKSISILSSKISSE